MDSYDAAIKQLRADKRSIADLHRSMRKRKIKIPYSTLREIKAAVCTTPQLPTLRKIAAFYGLTA